MLVSRRGWYPGWFLSLSKRGLLTVGTYIVLCTCGLPAAIVNLVDWSADPRRQCDKQFLDELLDCNGLRVSASMRANYAPGITHSFIYYSGIACTNVLQ
jgi:hypothetical protein